MHAGVASSIASTVTHSVPTMNGQKPNLPCSGCQTVPVIISASDCSPRTGSERTSSATTSDTVSSATATLTALTAPVTSRSITSRKRPPVGRSASIGGPAEAPSLIWGGCMSGGALLLLKLFHLRSKCLIVQRHKACLANVLLPLSEHPGDEVTGGPFRCTLT